VHVKFGLGAKYRFEYWPATLASLGCKQVTFYFPEFVLQAGLSVKPVL